MRTRLKRPASRGGRCPTADPRAGPGPGSAARRRTPACSARSRWGDKAHSSRRNRRHLRRRQIKHTIPEPKDRRADRRRSGSEGGRPTGFDREIYRCHNETMPRSGSRQRGPAPGMPKKRPPPVLCGRWRARTAQSGDSRSRVGTSTRTRPWGARRAVVRAAISEELASSFPQVPVKVIHAGNAAEGPHPNVKSEGDRAAGRSAGTFTGCRRRKLFKSPRTQGR